MVDGSALWLGTRGFIVRDVVENDDGELVVAIETTNDFPVGCTRCGTRARAKDRRRVRLRDVPQAGRPVLLEWWTNLRGSGQSDCRALESR